MSPTSKPDDRQDDGVASNDTPRPPLHTSGHDLPALVLRLALLIVIVLAGWIAWTNRSTRRLSGELRPDQAAAVCVLHGSARGQTTIRIGTASEPLPIASLKLNQPNRGNQGLILVGPGVTAGEVVATHTALKNNLKNVATWHVAEEAAIHHSPDDE